MIDEAQRLLTSIKQMEASLVDDYGNGGLNSEELNVTFPLKPCLMHLREKYTAVNKERKKQFEQIKSETIHALPPSFFRFLRTNNNSHCISEIVDALQSYAAPLEQSFVSIDLPPTAPGTEIPPDFDLSPAYASALNDEFARVYEEYFRRITFVQSTCEDIVKLWADLGTPQVQTDPDIISCYRGKPEMLGLQESQLKSLWNKHERLVDEKRGRERKLKDLKAAVEALWERLGYEGEDRKAFLARNRGCGLRVINEFQDELERLNNLKRQNLHVFVEDARCRLQDLWDSLYFSEEEMLDFTPAFNDVCTDALLEAHEAEIQRLESLREQRAPVLQLIDRHRDLLAEKEALNASSQDASRLMARGNKGEKRDPGKLLREEKMRKRIAKELPKVENDLRAEFENWEDEYGRPFLVYGERYIDELGPPAVAPARSKTPTGPSTASRVHNTAKPVPLSSSRPASTSKVPSMAPRSATKKPSGENSGRGIHHVKQGSATIKSPTRIPARAPLSSIPHGGNNANALSGRFPAYTISGKMSSARAPIPASMRAESKDVSQDQSTIVEPLRSNSALSNTSIVRSVTPLDVYDDHQPSFMSASTSIFPHLSRPLSSNSSIQSASYRGLPVNTSHPVKAFLDQRAPPTTARQYVHSENSSRENTVMSGSENWETFDDASGSEEPPADVTDEQGRYYAELGVAPLKRMAPAPLGDSNNGRFVSKAPSSKGFIRSVSPGF